MMYQSPCLEDAESSRPLTGHRVLVLEDEFLIRLLLGDMLEDLGCDRLVSVSNPDEAMEAIQTRPIDAALLDVNLKHESSYAVARELSRRNVPFLFVTAVKRADLDREFGGRPVLSKPFSEADFISSFRKILKLPSGQKQSA